MTEVPATKPLNKIQRSSYIIMMTVGALLISSLYHLIYYLNTGTTIVASQIKLQYYSTLNLGTTFVAPIYDIILAPACFLIMSIIFMSVEKKDDSGPGIGIGGVLALVFAGEFGIISGLDAGLFWGIGAAVIMGLIVGFAMKKSEWKKSILLAGAFAGSLAACIDGIYYGFAIGTVFGLIFSIATYLSLGLGAIVGRMVRKASPENPQSIS